jgi:hypothetical protein
MPDSGAETQRARQGSSCLRTNEIQPPGTAISHSLLET